jgi:hypothetical protein
MAAIANHAVHTACAPSPTPAPPTTTTMATISSKTQDDGLDDDDNLDDNDRLRLYSVLVCYFSFFSFLYY